MSEAFDDEDFTLEDEWVEISDSNGNKASLRHLATIQCDGKSYSVLGQLRGSRELALMLVREDLKLDGAMEYVMVRDEQEIGHVIGRLVMRLLGQMLALESEESALDYSFGPCGMRHAPGEFCCCDDPEFLQ